MAMTKALITAALDIEELAYTLRNVAQDDKCELHDLKDEIVIKEAKYVLGLFTDPAEGHMNGEDYRGENGAEQKTWAKGQVKELQAFLKKHGKNSQSTPKQRP